MTEKNIVYTGRNNGLDFLRLVGVFLVLCIHFPFWSTNGYLWVNAGRIAVPFFFMLTGYYYRHIIENSRQKQQIAKCLKIMIASVVVCAVYGAVKFYLENEMVKYMAHFTWKNLVDLVLFNNLTIPYTWHLWYLSALLYVLIIAALLSKKLYSSRKFRTGCYIYSILSLILSLMLGKYSALYTTEYIPICYGRNFLLTGFPFFMIGMACDYLDDRKTSDFRLFFFTMFTLLMVFLTIRESHWLQTSVSFKFGDLLATTPFLAVSVFFWGLHLGRKFNQSRVLIKLGEMARNYSLPVFIFHTIIWDIAEKLLPPAGELRFFCNTYTPVVLFVIAFFVCILVSKIITFFNIRKIK